MGKRDLLAYLARVGDVDAIEAADAFGVAYATAAMALLRLTRQGLVRRYSDVDRGLYFYELTERGHERLAFFRRGS